MKSYTNIEESKKLAEILPPESADMCWGISDETLKWKTFPYLLPWRDYTAKEHYLPCWSLAALLDQLDDVICDKNGYEYKLEIIKEGVQYYLVYEGMLDAACYETSVFDDLIDACIEMIFILKEKDLI
jgi:hypothetical protein